MCGPENPNCDCAKPSGATVATSPIAASPIATWSSAATAQTTQQTIVAAVAEGVSVDDLPAQWHAVAIVEGLRTTDHRAIARGGGDFRQLPLPIFAQFLNSGHFDSAVVGSITSITMDGDYVMAEGTFDLSLEEGQQAALMCKNQTLRWVSADIEVLESQYVEVTTGDSGDPLDILFGDDSGVVTDWYDEVLAYRIMGVTMCATPAFPQCVIAPIDVALDIPEPMGSAPTVQPGMLASGVTIPTTPPASWFADPHFDEPTPLTIDNDGRVFGHLATWGQCHTSFPDTCLTPPRSAQDYAYFRTGKVVCEGGESVRVGQITFDTGHAGTTLGWSEAARHYDHTGTAVADVAVGEDDFGIWFAGALRPGLSDDIVRTVRASSLSGDWRKLGGGLELVAALAVNVPGFPIVASGKIGSEQVSLVAGGVRRRDPVAEIAREIARVRQAIAPLMDLSVERLAWRVNGPPAESHDATIESLRERVNASSV